MESRNAYYTVASNNIYTHHQCSSVLLSVGHILSCENGISDTTISRITFNLSFSLLVLSVYRQLPFPYSFRPFWDWLYEGAKDKTIYQGWWWRWRWNGTLMMIIMLLASGMHCFSFPPDIHRDPSKWLNDCSLGHQPQQTPSHLPISLLGLIESSSSSLLPFWHLQFLVHCVEVLLLTVTGNESCGVEEAFILTGPLLTASCSASVSGVRVPCFATLSLNSNSFT